MRRMVMKQVGWMAGIGAPVGIGAALLIGNLAASFLFGLTPTDPRAVVAAIILLAGAVFAASYWPARRAWRVDPVVALQPVGIQGRLHTAWSAGCEVDARVAQLVDRENGCTERSLSIRPIDLSAVHSGWRKATAVGTKSIGIAAGAGPAQVE